MIKYAIAVVACAVCGLGGAVVGQAVTAARVPATSLVRPLPPTSAVDVATVTQTVGATRTTVVTRTAIATHALVVLATDTPAPATATETATKTVTNTVTTTPQYADSGSAQAMSVRKRNGDDG